MTAQSEEIKKNIIDQMYWDSRLDTTGIQVDVTGGTVRLTGTVPSHAAREAAWADAVTVRGVELVENDLQVKHPSSWFIPPDKEIESYIKKVIDWDAELKDVDIHVELKNGVVKLTGTVDRYWKKLKAGQLVTGVKGVIAIENELAVVPTDTVADKTIAEGLVAAFKRTIGIAHDNVEVKVENGIVTLQGTVATWIMHRSIHDVAKYTPGVVEVVDRIKVSPEH